ncbi:MAG TPA: POTRA domain-containing protein [Silvibacterium sp.]|nr:POTRA domain-containing protein [Silvibacterium sp.]
MRIRGWRWLSARGCYSALICIFVMLLAARSLRAQVGSTTTGTPATSTTPQAGRDAQQQPTAARVPGYNDANRMTAQPAGVTPHAATDNLRAWEGLRVEAVEFKGVDRSRLEPLPEFLALQPNRPLGAEDVRDSLRQLYATGLYKEISVEGERHGNSVTLIFNGMSQFFLGRVTVDGVKDDRLASQLERSTRLIAGTRYTDAKMTRAARLLTQTLQENGYYLGTFTTTTTKDSADALVNIHYEVKLGKQTRLGAVKVSGDSGLTIAQFRKKGKLKAHSKVTRDTVSRALSGVQNNYEKKQRLEATVSLASKQFQPPLLDLNFLANQGPLVTITVNGVHLSKGKIKSLVPVFQEGTVDEDLLNEGDRRLRDYYQRRGYFDAEATHTRSTQGNGAEAHTQIVFNVKLGERREVTAVRISGNHYFSDSVILPRLTVHKADLFMRHGQYSQALAQADVNTIEALYESNGFSNVTVTPVVRMTAPGGRNKTAGLSVNYQIVEGTQDLIGKYEVTGNQKVAFSTLKPLLSTEAGQPYSATTIVGDRDEILTYYYSQGFDHATVALSQKPEPGNARRIDVSLNITEGNQTFVNRVLVSGLHYTRPSTVAPHIHVTPGQPLNQSALLETQRQLYDLTLFNEVNTAVEDPNGNSQRKDVLVQFTEAKRWDVSYGFGFQAQTGNPSTSCPNPVSLIQLGINPSNFEANCGTNGKTGASALVLFDASRINLWGRNQSITLRTEYGSLEQSATTIYSFPQVFNRKTFDFSLSGGYTNAQDVTTYAASRLEGTVRFTERPNRPNTLLYQFTYRRVKVDPNSVQVSPNEIPLVSEPVRVGGPGLTWIRDTRRPTPLDAVAGTYTSAEEFVTDSIFASQANFNRLDLTNSSYYRIGKRQFVLARNTRFGYERSFGRGKYEYIPLPERLYAGGAQSLRGFSINSAGPRDALTGFPIGGAGVFVNSTELRFPNPNLPYFGTALAFVLFHDTGNVFNNSSDIWPSAIRIKQPHSSTCKDLTAADQQKVTRSSSTNPTGTCDFNDFSHALGLGARYHTPIGPIRLDFSYNLNPPIYPVVITFGTHSDGSSIAPHVGQASHFNFFFSIGQAF